MERMPADRMPATTRWDGACLRVERYGREVDCVRTDALKRVILVCAGGDTPSQLQYALLDLGDEHLLLPADSGIARPVYFECQGFWAARACIWWLTRPHRALPRAVGAGVHLLDPARPPQLRLPARALAPVVDDWPLEGPQTWEQRRWSRGARDAHA